MSSPATRFLRGGAASSAPPRASALRAFSTRAPSVEFLPPQESAPSPHLARLGLPGALDDGVIVGEATLDGAAGAVRRARKASSWAARSASCTAPRSSGCSRARDQRPAARRSCSLIDSGGVRLHEANAGLIAISEIMRAVLDVRAAGIPVLALIGGMCGAFGGMGIVARLCSRVIMSEEGRLALSGPDVIETVAGVEEFDARDRALVWRVTGGKHRCPHRRLRRAGRRRHRRVPRRPPRGDAHAARRACRRAREPRGPADAARGAGAPLRRACATGRRVAALGVRRRRRISMLTAGDDHGGGRGAWTRLMDVRAASRALFPLGHDVAVDGPFVHGTARTRVAEWSRSWEPRTPSRSMPRSRSRWRTRILRRARRAAAAARLSRGHERPGTAAPRGADRAQRVSRAPRGNASMSRAAAGSRRCRSFTARR